MKLYPIHATGIRAFCSDLIVDQEETVYFMSVCGYQATVKGIVANLLEQYGLSIDLGGVEHYLTRSSLGYKVKIKKLPSGLAHALVFPELALPRNNGESSFFVFTNELQGRLTLFFRHLDQKTEIPLHPSWAGWLWKVFKQQEDWLTELKTLIGAYRGYSLRFHPKELQDLISRAIRNKTPEIVACMQQKGGSDGTFDFSPGFPG